MRMRSVLLLLAHFAAIAVIALYLRVEIYDWPEAEPFHGDHWYNPYDNALNNTPLRANFHAHTKSWLGLTYGNNSERELADAYARRGYDIIGISNYHSISTYLDTSPLFIPVHEHGLNILKVHNLPIGASEVLFPAFPLHFSIHQTQQMLNRTRTTAELNALCHPTMSRIPPRKMKYLTGYSLLEVGNTLGMSLAHWDAALSAGRLVWILSNDDTHDLEREPTFVKWNMIYASDRTAHSTLSAMKTGAHYGVESYRGACEATPLAQCAITGDTLLIAMTVPVNRIDLYGQGGTLVATAPRDSMISYVVQPEDTYLRAEIHMDECVYYLNPIVRTESGEPPVASAIAANVDHTSTWGIRLLLTVLILWIGFRAYSIARHHRSS